MEIFGEEDSALRTGVVSFFPYSFEASMKISNTFMHKEKRFSYSTPKSFLELLKLYQHRLSEGGAPPPAGTVPDGLRRNFPHAAAA